MRLYSLLLSLGTVHTLKCDQGQYVYSSSTRRRRRKSSIESCKVCVPGTYMNLHAHSQDTCFSCPSGLWMDSSGATGCNGIKKCGPGSWGIIGAVAPNQPCNLCTKGSVQPRAGQAKCHSCQSGTYSSTSGDTVCTPTDVAHPNGCGAGRYGRIAATSAGTATCTDCVPDTYAPHSGTDACRPCGRGTYQPKSGQSHCLLIPSCDRYYTWSRDTLTCVIRHTYIKYLSAVIWTTFILNFGAKCSVDYWYTKFFIYNFFVCIGTGSKSSSMGGGLITDKSFYTMMVFLSIGTLALCVNLMMIAYYYVSGIKCVKLTPRPPPGDVASVKELKRLDNMHSVV